MALARGGVEPILSQAAVDLYSAAAVLHPDTSPVRNVQERRFAQGFQFPWAEAAVLPRAWPLFCVRHALPYDGSNSGGPSSLLSQKPRLGATSGRGFVARG